MSRGKVRDRDGIFTRKDRPGAFYGSWVDATGRRRKRKLEAHTLQQARTLLNAEKVRAEQQRILGYAPAGKETLADVIPRYLSHQKVRLTAQAYQRTRGIVEGHLKPALGQVRLAKIRRVDVNQYATARSAKVAPGSVVKELNVLKHLLNLALEWELIPFNPAQNVKLPRVPAGRIRYLQPGELRTVLEACPEWLRPIAGLLAVTGMRRSEALNLRWLDIDRTGRRILLPQTKNGDGRIVYLNQLACVILDSLCAGAPTDRVFSVTNDVTPNNVSLAFLRACRRVGVEDFRLHDLRHTAASWLRMNGADLQDVAELLGHRDLRMTKRYSHLSPEHLQNAVEALDGVFASVKELLLPRGGKETDGLVRVPVLLSPQRPQRSLPRAGN
jgi:integrase